RSLARPARLALAEDAQLLCRGQPPAAVPQCPKLRGRRRPELDPRVPGGELSVGLSVERVRPDAPGARSICSSPVATRRGDLAGRDLRAVRALPVQARVLRAAGLPPAGPPGR